MPPNDRTNGATFRLVDNDIDFTNTMTAEMLERLRVDRERMREAIEAERIMHMNAIGLGVEMDEVVEEPIGNPFENGTCKKRHLTKPERDMLHKPASDWCETGRGEVCKSACTLEIDDIIIKKK